MLNAKYYYETNGETPFISYDYTDAVKVMMNAMGLLHTYMTYKTALTRGPQNEYYGKFVPGDGNALAAAVGNDGNLITERFYNHQSNFYRGALRWEAKGWVTKEAVPPHDQLYDKDQEASNVYTQAPKQDIKYSNQSVVSLVDLPFSFMSPNSSKDAHYAKLPTIKWLNTMKTKVDEEQKQPAPK